MKIFIVVILGVVLLAVAAQMYFIFKERNQLKSDLSDLNSRFGALSKENADLQAELEYYSHPENLVKELKSKFNYKESGEKMMIIVP